MNGKRPLSFEIDATDPQGKPCKLIITKSFRKLPGSGPSEIVPGPGTIHTQNGEELACIAKGKYESSRNLGNFYLSNDPKAPSCDGSD